ncbi:hypothetical protein OGAPHI_000027 [Ogataea philodendri]|uniref:Crossover junction endonuclease MUS81 n=1 Tax=Ogataea philodendri TaxID=1378263 RepID=A0A9P8TB69_9ASCO|nr:uncharacterized protein OGAPHI_000027 [Ogataea philodendri]KAH3671841.1 hypothetical protein OGAPHI_000027 [Ogataea philodendri]
MELPQDIKHLYVLWMEEELRKQQHAGSKLALTYMRAVQSVKQCPMMLRSPTQLGGLRFIGDKMVAMMRKKLHAYCEEHGYDPPEEAVDEDKENRGAKRTAEKSADGPKKRRQLKSAKRYIPQRNTGSYAILLALYINDPGCDGLTKDDIIKHASKYCTTSFTANPSTGQFYSAWGSIKTLEKNEYVQSHGRPVYYFLTETGLEVAQILKKVEDEQKDDSQSGADSSPILQRVQHEDAGLVERIDTWLPPMSRAAAKPANVQNVAHEIWPIGSYSVELVLDNREVRSREQRDFFSDQLTSHGVSTSVRALTVGDGVWVARHNESGKEAVLDFIFERKRLDDFAASIKDGRYFEQKSRLKRTGINTIFYIVEEQMSSDVSRFSEAIQTCISTSITNSRFHVKRTKDSDSTVQLLTTLSKKIIKYYRQQPLLVLQPRDLKSQQEYAQLLQQVSKENVHLQCVYSFHTFQSLLSKSNMVSVGEMFIKMLMTIKGVSLDKALAIQLHYKTPKNLLDSFEKCTTDKSRMIHDALKDHVGNRKIGSALSAKIYQVWGTQ